MAFQAIFADVRQALRCRCPRCGEGALYQSRYHLTLAPSCVKCGLDLGRNDSADGPAVFLIFLLGFLLVPLALALEFAVEPPLWVHAVLWLAVALGFTILSLRPLKTYIMLLQYRHRPGDWDPR